MSKRGRSQTVLTLKANDATAKAFSSVNGNFDRLERKIGTSDAAMRGYGSAVSTVNNNIGRLSGLVGGISLVALGAQTAINAKEAMVYADALDMSVQALSEWQIAAKTVNLDGSKMADMFKDLSEKIGEAAEFGSGEGIDAIKKLNLDAKELVKLTPEKQLLEIAGALGKIETTAGRGSLMEQLVSDGTLLLPLLDDNAAKFRELRDIARERGDILTDEEADRIADVNVAIGETNASINAVGQSLLVAFGPGIVAGSESISDALQLVARNGDAVRSVMVAGAVAAGVYTAAKIATSDASRGFVKSLRAEYEQNLANITTTYAYTTSLSKKSKVTRVATETEKRHAAAMTVSANSSKLLGSAVGVLVGPLGLAALAGGLASVALGASSLDAKTEGLVNQFLRLDGATKNVKLSKINAEIFDYQQAIRKLESAGVPGIFGDAEKYNKDLSALRHNLTILKKNLRNLDAGDGDSGSAISAQMAALEVLVGQQRTAMAGLAGDYQAAFSATRSPVESLNAELQKSYDIYAAFGNGELYDRQVSAAVAAYAKLAAKDEAAAAKKQALSAKKLAALEVSLQREVDAFSLSQMTEEQRLGESWAARVAMIQLAYDDGIIPNTLAGEARKNALILEQETLFHAQRAALLQEQEALMLEQSTQTAVDWGAVWADTVSSFSSGIGNAVADAVIDQKDLGESLRALTRSMAKEVISSLVRIGTQRLIQHAMGESIKASETASSVAAAGVTTAAWAPAAAVTSAATFGSSAVAGLAALVAITAFASKFGGGGGVSPAPSPGPVAGSAVGLSAGPAQPIQPQEFKIYLNGDLLTQVDKTALARELQPHLNALEADIV